MGDPSCVVSGREAYLIVKGLCSTLYQAAWFTVHFRPCRSLSIFFHIHSPKNISSFYNDRITNYVTGHATGRSVPRQVIPWKRKTVGQPHRTVGTVNVPPREMAIFYGTTPAQRSSPLACGKSGQIHLCQSSNYFFLKKHAEHSCTNLYKIKYAGRFLNAAVTWPTHEIALCLMIYLIRSFLSFFLSVVNSFSVSLINSNVAFQYWTLAQIV